MPNYGSTEYWDNRYSPGSSMDDPFDWLFSYEDVAAVLDDVIHDKSEDILMVGAGNAPFSPDMHAAGYVNIHNIDLSPVCVETQRARFPFIRWEVMDVMQMRYADKSFQYIIDKSLIDTLLCYNNSLSSTKKMIDELYRVLKPGGLLITMSLHTYAETGIHYEKYDTYNWRVSNFRVRSSRWNDGDNRRKSLCHLLLICEKPLADGSFREKEAIIPKGVLSDEEFERLTKMADEVNLRKSFEEACTDDMMQALLAAVTAIHKPTPRTTPAAELEPVEHETQKKDKKQKIQIKGKGKGKGNAETTDGEQV